MKISAGADRFYDRIPPWKQKKLEKIKNERARAESICAWALLFYALQEEYGITEWPNVQFGPHGKPEFVRKAGKKLPCFSLSHTDGWVLCATSPHNVGADIQKMPPFRERTVLRYASAPELEALKDIQPPDKAAALLWTYKEAYGKYLGTGILMELRDLDFSEALRSPETAHTFYGLHFQTGTIGPCVYTSCGYPADVPVQVIDAEKLNE